MMRWFSSAVVPAPERPCEEENNCWHAMPVFFFYFFYFYFFYFFFYYSCYHHTMILFARCRCPVSALLSPYRYCTTRHCIYSLLCVLYHFLHCCTVHGVVVPPVYITCCLAHNGDHISCSPSSFSCKSTSSAYCTSACDCTLCDVAACTSTQHFLSAVHSAHNKTKAGTTCSRHQPTSTTQAVLIFVPAFYIMIPSRTTTAFRIFCRD